MKNQQELYELADALALQAKEAGCMGVIIALSDEYPEGHSSFQVVSRGRCLEIEGLATRVASAVARIWDGKLREGSQLPKVVDSVGVARGVGGNDSGRGLADCGGFLARGGGGGPSP